MRTHHPHRRRGATMIEFIFVLPALMALILLSIDMGRMAQAYGALSDAANVGATASAQVGTTDGGITQNAISEALEGLPVVGNIDPRVTRAGTARGPDAEAAGVQCTTSFPYVVVHVESDVSFITPGLGQMLTLLSPNTSDINPDWTLRTSGAALCQIAPRS